MPASDRDGLLDEHDFAGALAAWEIEFADSRESLPATWALAEIEERWGDWVFFAGEPGGGAHFQKAQRALAPPGVRFDSSEENERRMTAFSRLTEKLYAVAPDGTARPNHDGKPHPRSRPRTTRPQPPEAPPRPSIEERRAAVQRARAARTRSETPFGILHRNNGGHGYYSLAAAWFDAARALAGRHDSLAREACAWSRHYFVLYNRDWSAHLPASRWDSDGHAEADEVAELDQSLLAFGVADEPAPEWASALARGDWEEALAHFGSEPLTPQLGPLAGILADTCRSAGRTEEGAAVSLAVTQIPGGA